MADGEKEPVYRPRAPGWYDDPWSATGTGERYFDGQKWGTTTKPLGRHTRVRLDLGRTSSTKRPPRRTFGALLVFAVIVVAVWALPKLHQSSNNDASQVAKDRPPPMHNESSTALGVPAPIPPGIGKFEILESQPQDRKSPVAWDPCREIHYVVNPMNAPDDGLSMIQSAIARVQFASGLHFVYDGVTTEAPDKDRVPYQPDRYGKKVWAPVLFAWSDQTAYPELAGYVAGIGTAIPEYATDDRLVYVSGQVVLDDEQLASSAIRDRRLARAIVLHELGHVVGLDHTSDANEIMYSESTFNIRDFGPGDLQGLAELGSQPCDPNI